MESALTTRPPCRAASACASRDLPLAVGPASRMAARRVHAVFPSSVLVRDQPVMPHRRAPSNPWQRRSGRNKLLDNLRSSVHRRDGNSHVRHVQVSPAGRAYSARLVQHRRGSSHAGTAAAAPRHQAADRTRRPGGALPDGADRPGSLAGARDRDSRAGARDLQAVAPLAAHPRPPPGEGPRYPGPHLLQVRGRQPARQPQAEHGRAAGLLQQGSRHQEAVDRDRRRPVGLLARLCRRALRPRSQGLHGQGQLQPEALSPGADGDLRRHLHRQPQRHHQLRPRHPGGAPGFARQPRHRHLGGGRDRRSERRYQLLAGQRAHPRPHPPVGDRHRGHRADGDGRLLAGCGHRLRRRRLQLRRPRLPLRRQDAARGHQGARHSRSSRRPARRSPAASTPTTSATPAT